ncbi:tyrosine-type recombinase/integrase [Parasphingorhabdus sp.]|uniref:tyrosine-type recombinase/integrase n=1 Tax=Parasphingorhabdus sp. TaxID=2709688 RepID=UPI003D2977F3
MPKEKLTAQFVQLAYCPEGKNHENFYDTITTGFVLEVRKSGGKTYYIRYVTPEGKQRQLRIGAAQDITFDQARKKAQRLRSQVVLGGDPAAEKKEKLAVPTYGELAADHLKFAKSYQKSFCSTETNMRVHILPRWRNHKLTDIKQKDIAVWLAEKADEGLKPATVEKIRVLFHRTFELGNRWGVPGCEINPVKGIPRPQINNAREVYLTSEQAKELLLVCETSANTQLANIVGLLLQTAARVGELLQSRWEHIDRTRKLWLIPTSKTGKHRYVPLSGAALAIIDGLPKFDGCPWLLPNPDTMQPFVSIKHSWQTARKEAGLDGLHIHDLRHSAASMMASAGVDLYTIGKVLGHADYKSTMRYSHLANDQLLDAVEAGSGKLQVDW